VRDGSVGFAAPDALNTLVRANYFGLTGIAECVALADGRISIRSRLGQGRLSCGLRSRDKGKRMGETIRVVTADDHPLVRCGIRETPAPQMTLS
jgi:hypothetical protein